MKNVKITGVLIENQNICIETKHLNEMEPKALFLDITKTYGDNSTLNISLTPSEGRFLRDRLIELYPVHQGMILSGPDSYKIEDVPDEKLPEGAPVIEVPQV